MLFYGALDKQGRPLPHHPSQPRRLVPIICGTSDVAAFKLKGTSPAYNMPASCTPAERRFRDTVLAQVGAAEGARDRGPRKCEGASCRFGVE
jgi:hypothetical protein